MILGDLCDLRFRDAENAKLAEYWDDYSTELPAYTYFDEKDFDHFGERGANVEVRRSGVAAYRRSSSRFIVTLGKPVD